MRGQLFGRPLTHFQGSGGPVRAPCPIAVVGIDDFEPCVAIALPRNPELGRGDGLRQMKQLGVATEVQKHADLPGLGFPIKRDEDARAPDLGRIVDQRPLLELFHRRLELTKPGVDLLGVFVLAGVFLFQRTILGEERSVGRAFLVCHRRGITGQTRQTAAVAIGQVGRDLDPLPAIASERLGLRLKLLGYQPVEHGRALEPTDIIALGEIAQHDTACRLIGIDTDEDRATIRGPD